MLHFPINTSHFKYKNIKLFFFVWLVGFLFCKVHFTFSFTNSHNSFFFSWLKFVNTHLLNWKWLLVVPFFFWDHLQFDYSMFGICSRRCSYSSVYYFYNYSALVEKYVEKKKNMAFISLLAQTQHPLTQKWAKSDRKLTHCSTKTKTCFSLKS